MRRAVRRSPAKTPSACAPTTTRACEATPCEPACTRFRRSTPVGQGFSPASNAVVGQGFSPADVRSAGSGGPAKPAGSGESPWPLASSPEPAVIPRGLVGDQRPVSRSRSPLRSPPRGPDLQRRDPLRRRRRPNPLRRVGHVPRRRPRQRLRPVAPRAHDHRVRARRRVARVSWRDAARGGHRAPARRHAPDGPPLRHAGARRAGDDPARCRRGDAHRASRPSRAASWALPTTEVTAAAALAARVLAHPLLAAARAADANGKCRREVPVTLTLDDGRLLEGVVDLAWEHEGTWTVVDFKTDEDPSRELDAYSRQVGLYAAGLNRVCSGSSRGALLVI